MPPHSKAPSRSGGKRGSGGADVFARQRALYALPLDDFTRARDALAEELASRGQAKDAQATKKLKRPVVAAWVVNQLAHRHAKDIEALLEAARSLEKAHRRALSGLAPGAFKEANRAFQRALDALMADANALLVATGRPASSNLIRQVDETLRAASLGTEEDRFVLSQGMLTRPLQHSGFGPFSQLLPVGPAPEARPRSRPTSSPSNRPPAKAPKPLAPATPSTGGKVLQGPWMPRVREQEAPPRPPRVSQRQLRGEADAQARRRREAELDQLRREAELEQRSREAEQDQRRRKAEERAELNQLRREARQQAAQARRDERSTSREVVRTGAALKTAEAKTVRARHQLEAEEAKVLRTREALEAAEEQALQARQALDAAEEAEQQQAEAASRAKARAQAAEEMLTQAQRLLREAKSRRPR